VLRDVMTLFQACVLNYHKRLVEWFGISLSDRATVGMMQAYPYPKVTDELLAEAVSRMLAVGNPLKIVLFGSRARGKARPDSDLDLLVIEESDLPRYKRSGRYRQALLGLFPSKDIVVWTPQEVREWQTVENAFITTALREGVVLYER
jgi:predicted nucleotidyltransferase